MSKRLRRPGSPWRILVHEPKGASHHVTNERLFGRPTTGSQPDSDLSKTVEIPGTEFDELVVGRWIHLEQMSGKVWWMNVGGVTINVTVDKDGNPKRVRVDGPLDYDEPVKGCRYECEWTDPPEPTKRVGKPADGSQ